MAVDEENLFRAVAAQRLLIEKARSRTQEARRKSQQQRSRIADRSRSPRAAAGKQEQAPEGPFKPYAYELWDDV